MENERATAVAAWVLEIAGDDDGPFSFPRGGPPHTLAGSLTRLPSGILAALADAPQWVSDTALMDCIIALVASWHRQQSNTKASSIRQGKRVIDVLDACLATGSTLQYLTRLTPLGRTSDQYRAAASSILNVVDALPGLKHLRPPLVLCEQDEDTLAKLQAVAVACHMLTGMPAGDITDVSIDFIRTRLSDIPRLIHVAHDRQSLDPAVLAPAMDHPVPAVSDGAL